MMGWQWHQLDHMQITCTSLQTDNHASTSPGSPRQRTKEQYNITLCKRMKCME